MRALVIVLISILALGFHAMADVVGVTSNVLKRVVRIAVGKASGTAFTVDVDGHQYLITAKHVIAELHGKDGNIQVCGDGGICKDQEVTILRCDDPIDIAVLIPRTQLTVAFPLPADSKGMVLGQDVYFVGFPYADQALTTTTTAAETIGFVRKAIWSAQERKGNYTRLYFDGRNNSGFSGAPVVFLQQGKAGVDFIVAGVISGFRTDFSEVVKPQPIAPDQITDEDRALNRIVPLSDGSYRKLVPTGDLVAGNTGIVVAYDIAHAIDLIRKSDLKGPAVK